MEDCTASSTDEDDPFFDASDDFPFYDCLDALEGTSPFDLSLGLSLSCDSKLIELSPKSPPETPSSAGLRRRRSFARYHRLTSSNEDSTGLSSGISINSELTGAVSERREGVSPRVDTGEREGERMDSDRAESSVAGVINYANKEKLEESTITSSNANRDENSAVVESSPREINEEQPGFFLFLASLIIKAIGFQFNLMISFLNLPFWLVYTSYMFLLNPFLTMRRGRDYLIGKLEGILSLILEGITPFLSERMKENQWLLKLAMRCGWGLFWSAYVCSVLVSLLVSAFLGGGLMVRYLVEDPFWLKQTLNFDFTKNSPVAVVPITTTCPAVHCVSCVKRIEMVNSGAERVIPPNHKLQATVGLILPESYYNRNLGMFQVRIEYVSAIGKTLAGLSHPCMLHFKSEPVRLLLTFFKIVPLVSGYLSESQTLLLKIKGYTEGDIPTACLKVTIEQRAEFQQAGGIPEVYDAFLVLESELPFFKSIVWGWRRTIFVWLSMMIFMIELLFALVCCHNVMIPSIRRWGSAAQNTAYQRTGPVAW